MALVDVDSWETEVQACRRLSLTLQTQLSQREKHLSSSAEYSRFTSSIEVGLRQFETEVQELQNKLNSSSDTGTITQSELNKRRKELGVLQDQQRHLQTKFNKAALSQRDELFAGASSSSNVRQNYGGDNLNAVEVLKQRQIDILEKQNEGLEVLSQTLSRQKVLAQNLHREVDDQNDIIDNMANTLDRVEAGVSTETRNITVVNRRDSTWGYWLVIILLLVVILLVLFL